MVQKGVKKGVQKVTLFGSKNTVFKRVKTRFSDFKSAQNLSMVV